MKEPKWVTVARERVNSTKRIKVGSDVHLLEMAVNDYEAAHKLKDNERISINPESPK